MKFKGSGHFQNVTLLRDNHVLNTFYLGTSSSRLDDVEWFTGVDLIILLIHIKMPKSLDILIFMTRSRGYKNFFVLKLAEHDIYPAHFC